MNTYDLGDITEPFTGASPHAPTDPDKVKRLAVDMAERGWTGPPVVFDAETGQAFTGSHRIAAAWDAEISVPGVPVAALLGAHGDVAWADLLEEWDGDADEAARYIEDHLPAELREWLGIDWH